MIDMQGWREVSIFKWVNQLLLLQFNLWARSQIFHLLKTNVVFILLMFLLLFLLEMKHEEANIFMVFLFCFQSWNHSIVPSRCSHINRAIELWQNRVIQQYLFVKIGFKKTSWCSSGSLAAFHSHFFIKSFLLREVWRFMAANNWI